MWNVRFDMCMQINLDQQRHLYRKSSEPNQHQLKIKSISKFINASNNQHKLSPRRCGGALHLSSPQIKTQSTGLECTSNIMLLFVIH